MPINQGIKITDTNFTSIFINTRIYCVSIKVPAQTTDLKTSFDILVLQNVGNEDDTFWGQLLGGNMN
jgi:hypothetical protein